jgi:predicted nucleotidyltransferase
MSRRKLQSMIVREKAASAISSARRNRLRAAHAALKEAVDRLVREYGVRRIVLIGSLAAEGRFGFHSDIDLAVEGLPDKLYFKALGELLLAAGEFDIDLIPLEGATERMRENIEKGKVLYEKG